MSTIQIEIDNQTIRLNANQVHNMRKLGREQAKVDEAATLGFQKDRASVLLTRAEYKSLYNKGMVTSYRLGLYKGMVPAYITEFGKRVLALLPPKESK